MDTAIQVLGIIGTIMCGLASFLLAFKFGIIFRDNDAGIFKDNDAGVSQHGKIWVILKITTMERGQKFCYYLLGGGFLFLLLAQILSCLI